MMATIAAAGLGIKTESEVNVSGLLIFVFVFIVWGGEVKRKVGEKQAGC